MLEKNKNIKGGLKKERPDRRDFSFAGVFGKVEVPIGDFTVSEPLEIKDQRDLDFCTGYSLASVSEDQEGVPLSPEFVFAMIKKQQGSWKSWGGGLREGCKVATKVGFAEKTDVQFVTPVEDLPRNFLANWNNYSVESQIKAQKHIKRSFVKVDGGPTIFDAIWTALWANRGQKQSVYTGVTWRPSWMSASKGIILNKIIQGGVGHAIKVFGIKYFNGQPYLMVQNSYGKEVGDGGIFYFPREVVNREFVYGAYQFVDMPPEEIKGVLKEKGLLIDKKSNFDFLAAFWWKVQEFIKNL